MKKIKLTNEKRSSLTGLCFTLPWIIGFIYFFLIPFFKAILYSFSSIRITKEGFDLSWVGWYNYNKTLFTDTENLRMIITSVGEMIATVVVVVIFSLFIAIILNQNFKGRGFVRAVFALPIIISSGVIIYLLKQNVLQQNMDAETTTAIFQATDALKFLSEAGIPQKIVTFFESIVNGVFDMVWNSGMQIILFLSALQTIPSSSYEAAKVEGASAWESFWFVTFPMIGPFLLVNIIYTIIDSFTDTTNSVMMKISDWFTDIRYAEASSLSMSYFLIILIIVIAVFIFANKKINYSEM